MKSCPLPLLLVVVSFGEMVGLVDTHAIKGATTGIQIFCCQPDGLVKVTVKYPLSNYGYCM